MVASMSNRTGTAPERLRVSKTRCLNCNSVVKVSKPRQGAVIICPACGVELEIVHADPLEVDFTENWQED